MNTKISTAWQSASAFEGKPEYLETAEVLGHDQHELSMASKAELAVPQLQQGCHSQWAPRGGHSSNSSYTSRVGFGAEYLSQLQEALCSLETNAWVAAVNNTDKVVTNLQQSSGVNQGTTSFSETLINILLGSLVTSSMSSRPSVKSAYDCRFIRTRSGLNWLKRTTACVQGPSLMHTVQTLSWTMCT